MKVLYFGRLFSGLRGSVVSGNWAPSGAPTIYKIIEALDQRATVLDLVLTDRTAEKGVAADAIHAIDGLKSPVRVLSQPPATSRFGKVLAEIWIVAKLWRLAKSQVPDVVYIGNENIIAAAILSRWTNLPVVFRVMGVYPSMHAAIVGNGLAQRVHKWCYRSPFALVVGTQDGSGTEAWVKAAMSPSSRCSVMVNGVDRQAVSQMNAPLPETFTRGKTVVLFLGTLSAAKGALEFVEAIIKAHRAEPDIVAAIVGDGPSREALEIKINDSNLSDKIMMINRLPHNSVQQIHDQSDIYVSLNRLGNLSNANLEALAHGDCTILLEGASGSPVDSYTDANLPADTAFRVSPGLDIDEIAEAIVKLHRQPEKRTALSKNARAWADQFIPTWQKRVDDEMELLDHVANGLPAGGGDSTGGRT